jgi:3D (Asp-Asp-Asp) domain-containing protein
LIRTEGDVSHEVLLIYKSRSQTDLNGEFSIIMCSKNLVPRVVLCTFFFILLSFTTLAQKHLLGEAWNTSGKSSSETTNTSANAAPIASTPTTARNAPQVAASAWFATGAAALPVEPHIIPANPPLALEAVITAIKLSKLEAKPGGEELVGVEPPATFHATAYSLRGITRAGTRVRRGVIAADPRVLPLGSVVHLKAGNYSGLYKVHDTGGSIKGKRIDVWMPSSREARSFGRQNVRLTVLKYGGGRKPKVKR